MLRRPSGPVTTTGASGTAVLARRGSARPALGGSRRRLAGRDVPVQVGGDGPVAAGVVPRMRRPRAAEAPSPAGSLDARIERHLTRLRGTTPTARPGTVDDDRARRDPDTTSFAAVRLDAGPDAAGARVATPADRPATAELPALTFGRTP